jgi:hypothetical protein
MHQIITGSAARHNSGVRHNFRADCKYNFNNKMYYYTQKLTIYAPMIYTAPCLTLSLAARAGKKLPIT